MRKAFLLVLVGLLVAAAPVFAQDEAPAVTTSVGAALSLESKSTIDQTNFENPDNDASFGLTPSYAITLSASQGDLWSASAALLTDEDVVNAWKASVTTSLLKVSAAVDVDKEYQLGAISDPFSFVTINDADELENGKALRLESSVLGPALTLQFDSVDNVSAAASYSLTPVTVGALVKGIGKSLAIAGHGTVSLGIADVTAGFAQDRSAADDNSAIGVQATVKPIEGTEISGTFTRQAKNFADGLTSISASASTALGPLSVTAGYSRATATDSGDLDSDDITGSVTYDVAPIKATVSGALGNPSGFAQTNRRMKIEATAEYGLIPDVATVKASFLNESDKDTDLTAFTEPTTWDDTTDEEVVSGGAKEPGFRYVFKSQSHMKVGGSVDYKLTDAVTVTPSFAYHTWGGLKYRIDKDANKDAEFKDTDAGKEIGAGQALTEVTGSITQLEFGASLSYALNDAASLSVSFSQSNYSFPSGITSTDAGTVATNPIVRKGSVSLSLSF